MRMPRFQIMTLMIAVAAVALLVALVIYFLDRFQTILWVGHASVRLDVLAMDESGAGVPSARIELYEFEVDGGPPNIGATTGSDGRVTLKRTVMVHGTRSRRLDTEATHPFYLKVSATGYETTVEELTSLSRNPRQFHSRIPAPLVVVRLRRSQTTTSPAAGTVRKKAAE
jgi:hypothetical protein